MNFTETHHTACPEDNSGRSVETKRRSPLLGDLLYLFLKIAVAALFVVLLFTYLFGVYRVGDISMQPSIKDGDLVFYYRLDRVYTSTDVVVTSYQDRELALRVIAVAGDEVDIREDGLYINGSRQLETGIYEETFRYTQGISFPLTVAEGEVFLLGDSRENATDSRIFGTVKTDDILGKVMLILRRRGI